MAADPDPLEDEPDEEADDAPESAFAAAGFSPPPSPFVEAALSAFSDDPPSDESDFSEDDDPDVLDEPERLSLWYQPLPLKTMPTEEKTFRSRPPHSGHSVNDGSLNACTCSKRWSQAVQA